MRFQYDNKKLHKQNYFIKAYDKESTLISIINRATFYLEISINLWFRKTLNFKQWLL